MIPKGNQRKHDQLGMNYGTASNRLKKTIMFNMAKQLGQDECFQCGKPIDTVKEFSIDHKIPWLNSGDVTGLFFDVTNVAFSHLNCNSKASKVVNKKYFTEEAKKEAESVRCKVYRDSLSKEERQHRRKIQYERHGR